MTEITYLAHGGHFICADRCAFRIAAHVNGYLVSAVGELKLHNTRDDAPFEPLGLHGLYEVFVFKAKPSAHKCCPFEMDGAGEIEGMRYDTADEARAAFDAALLKYAAEP